MTNTPPAAQFARIEIALLSMRQSEYMTGVSWGVRELIIRNLWVAFKSLEEEVCDERGEMDDVNKLIYNLELCEIAQGLIHKVGSGGMTRALAELNAERARLEGIVAQ